MSKLRPILFQDEMVRAILQGRKTQTRRVMKVQPPSDRHQLLHIMDSTNTRQVGKSHWAVLNAEKTSVIESDKRYFSCPYGRHGDRLWVRETFNDVNLQGTPGIAYRADDEIRDLMAEPSFQDEDGAFNYNDERVKPYHFAVWSEDLLSGAEGRWRPSIHMPRWASRITLEITGVRVERLQGISEQDAEAEGVEPAQCCYAHYHGFSKLWQSINGPDSWDANPWVWVIEFRRIKP